MSKAQNYAAEIKIRAERRAGEMLKAMEKNKGGQPKRTGRTMRPVLEDLGIKKDQSSRWQTEASVPEAAFEKMIADASENDRQRGLSAIDERQQDLGCRETAYYGQSVAPIPAIDAACFPTAQKTTPASSVTAGRTSGCGIGCFSDEDHYQILSGHQRHAAALEAGLEEVPCWVVQQSDEQALMTLVTSNSQGEMDPLEIGIHCLKTVPEGQKGRGKTGGVREYASRVGQNQTNITQYRKGAEVAEAVKKEILVSHFLGRAGHLAIISKAPKPTWPILAKALVDDEWSRETTREIVDEVRELAIPASWEKLFLPLPKVVAKLLTNKAFTAAKVSELVQLAEAGSQMVLALCSRDQVNVADK